MGTEGSWGDPHFPKQGLPWGGADTDTLTPFPGAGGTRRQPAMLPLETQLCQPALPGGHKLQGGTRDTLPGVPAPQRATIIPVPFSLPALSPPASPSLGGQEPQVPAALPAGSLCTWGDRPQPCHGWDSRTGTPQAQYAQRRQHRAAALRLPGIAPGSSPQGQSIQHTHPYPGTKPPQQPQSSHGGWGWGLEGAFL